LPDGTTDNTKIYSTQRNYRMYANGMTGFNVAMSYNVKNAITGTYPAFAVNYPVAQISRGNLTGAATPAVVSTVARTI
jgi:hypothetical protein